VISVIGIGTVLLRQFSVRKADARFLA